MTFSKVGFSMTNQQLTALVLSNNSFLQSVEMSIKNTFRRPEAVKMQLVSAGIQMNKAPYFSARFEYEIEAERIPFGVCSYTIEGILKSNTSVAFNKLVHQDCGE